jgi:hypothetical protein
MKTELAVVFLEVVVAMYTLVEIVGAGQPL